MLPGSLSTNGQCRNHVQRRGTVGLYFVAGLSVLAGMTDAIGFMATGDFVSFMSGNTTRLPASLDSTSWNLPRPNWFLAIIALIWVLAPEPGSMP